MYKIGNDCKKIRIRLLWALIAAPFLGPYLYFINFEIAGVTVDVFRIVLGICLLTCIAMIKRKQWELTPVKGSVRWLILFFLIAFVIAGINIVFDGIHAGELSEMISLLIAVIYIYCINTIINGDIYLWEVTQEIYIVVGAVVLALSYIEVLFGLSLPSSRYHKTEYLIGYSAHPATSIYANENNLAAFFLIVSTIIIYRIFQEKNKKKRYLLYFEFLAIVILMMLTDSTIFRLGMIFEIILALILCSKIHDENKVVFQKRGLIVGLFYSLIAIKKGLFRQILLFGNILITCGWKEVTKVAISDNLKCGDDLSAQLANTGMGTVTIRKNLFVYGSKASMEKPILGHGAGSFSAIMNANEEWLKGTRDIVDPHNFLVELAVEYGLPLTLFFLLLCIVVLVKTAKEAGLCKNISQIIYIKIIMLLFAFGITTVMPSSFMKYLVYFIPLIIVVIGLEILKNQKIVRHRENEDFNCISWICTHGRRRKNENG